ncbi:hypothetical protein Chls_143 [Chlamydia suis]|uniref:Uncharacterized protein n=1 Tax=Chlamydia suis TaxID=83559 RepID=A0ABX6IQ56_9CHLA|nr:hypothetical protein Chls_143 [Chlamydia suis]
MQPFSRIWGGILKPVCLEALCTALFINRLIFSIDRFFFIKQCAA